MKVRGEVYVVRSDAGTTNKTCHHWFLRVNTDQGRKQKRFTGTYTQAKQEAAHFAASLVIPSGEAPFRKCSEKWLNRRIRSGNFATTTTDKDATLIRCLNRKFGDMPIGAISYAVAVDGLLDIKEQRNLGKTYAASLQSTLSKVLDGAVKDGEIASNPIEDLKPPKRDKSKRKALTYDQYVEFVTRLKMEPLTVHTMALRLLVFQGLRRGESVGLDWKEVNFSRGLLGIVKSVTDAGEIKEPKTSAGVRLVPMMKIVREDLEKWQEIQEIALKSIGIKQTLDTPVLTSVVGTRLNPQNLDRWWRKNRANYGLDGVVLHEMRHTFATLLANSGAQITDLPDIMGWTDISMANVYVHSSEERARRAMDELESILAGVI